MGNDIQQEIDFILSLFAKYFILLQIDKNKIEECFDEKNE